MTTKKEFVLTQAETICIAEKIAVWIDHDEEPTALLMLFLLYLEALNDRRDDRGIWRAIHCFRKHFFLSTDTADAALDSFQESAFSSRSTLLLWPNEREAK